MVQDYGVWGLKKFMGREYMGISRTTFIIDEYGVNLYTRQRVEWLAGSVESLFKNDRIKVFTLDDFI